MFKEYWIELDTIDGAKQLNAIALSYEEDIDIIKGTVRFVVMTVKSKLLMRVVNLFGNAQIATIEIKTR